jgi:flagellar hook protein FlgE
MALSSTLFTGLSGLVVNQTELNVVGNNIANANTTAFKSSTVQFSPQFYVTDSTGSLATSTSGGSNPESGRPGRSGRQLFPKISPRENCRPQACPATWPSTATVFSL